MITINPKMFDPAGDEYISGKIIVELDSGLEIKEAIGHEDEVIVEIIKEENDGLEYKLLQLLDKIFFNLETKRNILWPIKQIGSLTDDVYRYAAVKPHFIGEPVPIKKFVEDTDRLSTAGRKKSAEIGLRIAEIYNAVHEIRQYNKGQNCVLGIISQPLDNFFLDANMNVYFFDTFRCICGEYNIAKTCYIAPELLMEYDWREKDKITEETDSFIYALILFQILTGEFPYCVGQNVDKADVDQIWDRMCDGKSIFYYDDTEMFEKVYDLLNFYSKDICELFQRCFDYCGQVSYTMHRPTVHDWLNVLTEYVKNA